MAAEQGLQQLKSARAREYTATIALLAKVGYAGTTIAGVAQEAGFSKVPCNTISPRRKN